MKKCTICSCWSSDYPNTSRRYWRRCLDYDEVDQGNFPYRKRKCVLRIYKPSFDEIAMNGGEIDAEIK